MIVTQNAIENLIQNSIKHSIQNSILFLASVIKNVFHVCKKCVSLSWLFFSEYKNVHLNVVKRWQHYRHKISINDWLLLRRVIIIFKSFALISLLTFCWVFFQKIIDRYLYPLVEDKNYQAKVARDLKALRNNGCFAFFMINALWMVIYFFNLIHTSK